MSFKADFNTAINADANLNSLVDGGIFYQNLPDNFSLNDAHIVYSIELLESVDVISKKAVLENYNVELAIISPDTEERENILSVLNNYLVNYSDASILDVINQGTSDGADGEKDIYTEIVNYNIFYKP